MVDVIVIGGANIDIAGKVNKEIIKYDSNIGKIKISYGGVGRNIAENLAKMGLTVSLITAFGNDDFSYGLQRNCKLHAFDTAMSVVFPCSSSIYISLLDKDGEMQLAVNDMDVIENLTPAYIKPHLSRINKAKIVVLDTNLRLDTIEYLADNLEVPLFADAVSTHKAGKLKGIFDKIFALKPNKMEAEFLTGISIIDQKSACLAAAKLIEWGVKNVCITLGKDGVLVANCTQSKMFSARQVDVVNVSGAGDSFSAGMIYGFVKGKDLFEAAKLGMRASEITLQSLDTVSHEINESKLLGLMEGKA